MGLDVVLWTGFCKKMVCSFTTISVPVLMFPGPFLWQSGTYQPIANPYSYVVSFQTQPPFGTGRCRVGCVSTLHSPFLDAPHRSYSSVSTQMNTDS